ncbi:MAG TPA: CBS domain-containing protein [Longimicrobium sp.]|jgi:CBS domain-containing protein|nr:CBS domain-containing protein [Longimicrobium sp.]
MARYGRDFDRDRWGMQGDEGAGGGTGFYGGGDRLGNPWRGQGGGYGADYGGMGSDSQGQPGWSGGYRGGQSGFGGGGGSYDNDFGTGGWHGGEGVNWSHGGRLTRGQGGELYSAGGYGYETGGYGGMRDYGGNGYETGMGSDRGARDTGQGGGTGRGGGSQQQDETRRMRAVDIMTENPECVTPESSLADAAMKMRDLNVGIIPVVDSEQGRRLKGVITDRDITIRAVAEGMDARSTKVVEVMTTEVESCNKNDTVGDILRVMEREQVRRVPITDREGRLVGIVAQADVVRDIDGERGEHRVNDAIEHISEPTRGGGMGRPSQSRG